jgi:hypothetical protein
MNVRFYLVLIVSMSSSLGDVRAAGITNGSFEDGNYGGWTIISGDAWGSSPADLRGNATIQAWEGRYYANSFLAGESAVGVLQSSTFELTGPITLLMAGHSFWPGQQPPNNHNYVSLRRTSDHAELARLWAPGHNDLRSYVIDAPASIGSSVFLEVVDDGDSAGFSWIAVDFFVIAENVPLLSIQSDTWVATDSLGRTVPTSTSVGPERVDRFVGMYYYIWHGEWGIGGPYDIAELQASLPPFEAFSSLDAYLDALEPLYGSFATDDNDGNGQPDWDNHHWGQPLFGYYLSTDSYVLRKHMQMLQDIGVDTLVVDNTVNNPQWKRHLIRLMSVCQDIRNEGGDTPQITMIVKTEFIQQYYSEIYARQLFPDLWFRWRGKPLMLVQKDACANVDLVPLAQQFPLFTFRESCAWHDASGWFEQGQYSWPWIDTYPQSYGWGTDSSIPEAMPVSMALHPTANVGRSFSGGEQPLFGQAPTEWGFHYNEQWNRALSTDPEFVLITGWNEWTIGRWKIGTSFPSPQGFLGTLRQAGFSLFIDAFDHEYSRDAEPVIGGHSDNYYYQTASFVRTFKGASQQDAASTPVSAEIDGQLQEWSVVMPEFRDTANDPPRRREHPGYNNAGPYDNMSGRNDIIEAKMTYDACNLYVYALTRVGLTPSSGEDWMVLYLDTDSSAATGWAGYDYVVNRIGPGSIESNIGNTWNWSSLGTVPFGVSSNAIEIAIPRVLVGETTSQVAVDFKWADNVSPGGDVLRFTTHGDCAPNDRFNYRFVNSLPGASCECAADIYVNVNTALINDALMNVLPGGTLGLTGLSTAETLTIDQLVTLVACDGTVTIGQ